MAQDGLKGKPRMHSRAVDGVSQAQAAATSRLVSGKLQHSAASPP